MSAAPCCLAPRGPLLLPKMPITTGALSQLSLPNTPYYPVRCWHERLEAKVTAYDSAELWRLVFIHSNCANLSAPRICAQNCNRHAVMGSCSPDTHDCARGCLISPLQNCGTYLGKNISLKWSVLGIIFALLCLVSRLRHEKQMVTRAMSDNMLAYFVHPAPGPAG